MNIDETVGGSLQCNCIYKAGFEANLTKLSDLKYVDLLSDSIAEVIYIVLENLENL